MVANKWTVFVQISWLALLSNQVSHWEGDGHWEAIGGTDCWQTSGPLDLVNTWSTLGLHLVYTWSTRGLHSAAMSND